MRWSAPITSATATTSAPASSQIRASALPNEIFRARNALQACFASSAVGTSVSMSVAPARVKGRYRRRMAWNARTDPAPTRIRSGRNESAMARPSRRNSGLETTWNFRPGRSRAIVTATRSAVPAGTVDFSTTTIPSGACRATARAASSTATRLASPFASGGVPTQMKATSAPATASSGCEVKRRRPASSSSWRRSSSPGS